MTKSNSPLVHLGFAIPLTKKPLNQVEYKNNNSNPKKALPRHQQQKYHNVGHQSFHWRNWDGGKIGGQPSWLNPRDLPLKTLRCRSGYCCGDTTNNTTNTTSANGSGTILQFIAQVYCPADDDTKNEAAFHRSLYVFACPTCCSAIARENSKREKIEDGEGENAGVVSSRQQQLQQQHHRLSSCIRVLRCQLPLTNDFYPPSTTWPYDDDDFEHQWLLHTSEYWAKQTNNTSLYLCAVCGQRSKGKCPKQQLWFCGAEHQRECLRASKERMMVKSSTLMKEIDDEENEEFDGDDTNYLNDYLPSVCFEYELVVEDEPTPPSPTTTPCTHPTGDDDNNVSALFPHITDEDNDANLEQSDLNALIATGGAARGGGFEAASSSMMGVTDPVTLAFYDRLAIGGTENDVKNQCLRYCRWPEREKNPVLSNKEEKKKMILQNMMEGGDDSEREDEEEVDIGPLWLSSINCPPPNTETTTAATAITTTITQEENSASCPPSDAATTTIAAADSSTTNNSFPPPCQYCGARRSFEFQIMPQMLFYLLHSSKEQKNDGKFGTQKLLSELDKAILFEGQSKIDNGLDLPQGFTEAHGDAMKSAREALLGVMGKEEQAEDNNNTGSKKGEVGGSCLDWGTIAVYTCTASCGNGGIESKENGAYMEEVAWMQPPL